ncbi:unnamed protein product [Citrullus colocynthis]|uniref:Uncharacterized protein n=1 Tax=Citrullus colocynthis TaxID=252529 RepID=A0ABP0YGW1_9ROSI
MCPLRFILVFLSAILAGYIAWRSASSSSSSSSSDIFQATEASDKSPPENENRSVTEEGFGLKRTIQNGFWTFVDMASGRFLWRNLNASILNKNNQEIFDCIVGSGNYFIHVPFLIDGD